MISMADGTKKPIEDIVPGDMVLSFDSKKKKGRGKLKAARVTKTFQNVAPLIIDLHGLKCTPGHLFLNGEGEFEKIATILKKDGAIVDKDGALIRARTGFKVGSIEDEPINVAFDDPDRPGQLIACVVRAGIPCMRRASDREWVPFYHFLRDTGLKISGYYLVSADGEKTVPDWPRGKSPFDTELQRNFIIRDIFGQPYKPLWIETLPEAEEPVGEVRRHMALV